MPNLEVTFESLSATSSDLGKGGGEIDSQLTAMESKVRDLTNAGWKGAASSAFQDLWDQWQRGAADVREALDGISQMAGEAARKYEETEEQLASQIRG